MIIIDDVLISDDVLEKQFVCNISKCKGACCIEGDSGAPVEKEERKILKKIFPKIKKYLTQEGIEAIEKQGTSVDEEDDEYASFATPLINGGACAYINYDENGTVVCGIEQAYRDGVIDYQKPISCHLYPIRLKRMDTMLAMNYDYWEICKDACTLGKKLKVPVYQFLKEPIIRKFGEEFYEILEQASKK
ncbi:MAG: DUF3109 family protein [Sphingobacteriales bacterium]|jgi:hypothetical protein|nr:MAG: DUF3109 family protein [Sphingobacteriales bacterium]